MMIAVDGNENDWEIVDFRESSVNEIAERLRSYAPYQIGQSLVISLPMLEELEEILDNDFEVWRRGGRMVAYSKQHFNRGFEIWGVCGKCVICSKNTEVVRYNTDDLTCMEFCKYHYRVSRLEQALSKG